MPKYNCVIPTKGEKGNIFAILATAVQWMKEKGESKRNIKNLIDKVSHSDSFTEATNHIREYFYLEGDRIIHEDDQKVVHNSILNNPETRH